jgi:hypothetical protein
MRTRAPKPKRRATCRHPVRYETDWLGRTYAGCPLCNRWKLLKARLAA